MSATTFVHLRRVAALLMGVGGLLLLLSGLLGVGLPPEVGRDALVAVGACLCLAGAGQWWTLGRAQRAMGLLSEELTMMRRVAHHTGSPVLVTDNDLRVVWCNQAFERETGFRLGEVQGQHPGRLLRSPGADPVTVARVRDAVRHHTDIDIELLHRYRDGRDRWVRVILSSQRDDQGDFSGFVAVLVDIDAQVRTRETMRRALRHKGALMQTLQRYVIVAETDTAGVITQVNQRFQHTSGYSEAELLGQNFRLVSAGWHTPVFWRDMWQRIERGLPWRGEICNRSKSGRLYWVQTLITPFAGADGKIEKYLAIQSDVSDLRLAQIELRKSQTLLTRTSQLAGVGGWYVLAGGGGLHMTPECQQLLGVSDGEIDSIDELWRCFDAGARLQVREQLRELVARRRRDIEVVVPLRPLDNAPMRWVKLVAGFDEPESGGLARAPGRLVGAVQDYTPQTQAQQRIREEQRILHSAMDAVGEAFALYDPENRLVYFNDEYAAWLPPEHAPRQGMRYEEVLRCLLDRGDFKVDQGHESEWMQAVLSAPRRADADRIHQMADGRWIRFIDRLTPDGYRVVFRYDVTELQSALLRADAAALSKGQFLANMSHEIRTPINAILGLLQLLGHTRLDTQQADTLHKARRATRSLLEILNDVLDLSKIEAGKMDLHPVPFRLADLRNELELILVGALGSKDLLLVFDIDAALPPVVCGDPVRLRQVLINLGSNAIKFTERGRVVLRWHLLHQASGVARLRFQVSDTGIGIAPEQQQHIFDSFSQAESTTTRRFGGSGLGLTISQRLVSYMGGEIRLSSTPGEGSTFVFDIDLPLAAEQDVVDDVHTDPTAEGADRLSGLSLLLVEDNALNQEVALAMLRREGARVELAENGLQAVQALQARPRGFDLVLMDMQMPELDGLQATERIRDELGLRDLPVLAMTANAMAADRERCLQAGMNAHIGKPFDIDQVVALVLQFTRGAPLQSAPDIVIDPDEGMQEWPLREDTDTLRRLGGNAVLLAQLRGQFVTGAREQWRVVQACTTRSDWRQAADAVHRLKGSAGVVGAQRLLRGCAEIEQALRTAEGGADPGAGRWRQLQALLEDSLGALGVAPAARTAAPLQPATVDQVELRACRAALIPLKPLLEVADMTAIDLHEQWLAEHPLARSPRFERLNQLMEAMDLPAAAAECSRVLEGESVVAQTPVKRANPAAADGLAAAGPCTE
ncbi:ATP-binding protein [Hydrogenophaga sp.]|uniref:ATP-binding protein n=1 Tax=Hydrogenophaga sp. TaxID=1904254 RepID=UPI00286E2AC9|nr:ATP-binding protein [Hydrogenophaga sp.]